MYKLLIVDDEPLVQVGIKSMLNWADYDIEVIGTAVNGQIALNMIDEFRPELIITDIKMPVMDGLDLIKKCREKYGPDAQDFIILTSYEEFHMVKEAIKYQVTDYLIKVELTSETLSSTVLMALERVKKNNPGASNVDTDFISVMHDKFFIKLLNNLFESEEAFTQQSRDLSLDFNFERYICIYGCLDEDKSNGMALEHRLKLFQNSIQMINELVNKYMPCQCVGLDSRHFAIIFCIKEITSYDISTLKTKIAEIMESVKETLSKYYKTSFKYGIGRPVTQPLDIYESCKIARDELKSITGNNEDSSTDAGNHIVRNVKKYIKEHAAERLSLNEVASEFSISPNYLSQLFSRFNDCGFSEYVNICKIKESKKLLSEGKFKVYEVADMMGFESSFYFSKVFKKYEGISPTDYVNTL